MLFSAKYAPNMLVLRSKIALMWANRKAKEQKTYRIASATNRILSIAIGAVLPKATEQSAPAGVSRESQKFRGLP
jgi:hypothetical protein